MSAWIKMISDEEASPELLEILKIARTPHGTVDNVMRVHSGAFLEAKHDDGSCDALPGGLA